MDASRKTSRRSRDDDTPSEIREELSKDNHASKKIKTKHTTDVQDVTEHEGLSSKLSKVEDTNLDAADIKNEVNVDEDHDEKVKPEAERDLSHMYIDLEYLPASAPSDQPHVLDLAQEAVLKAIRENTIPLTQPDIVVTILYNYDQQLLKDFLGLTDHEYVHFRTHEYQTRWRGGPIELPSILIMRAASQITVTRTLAGVLEKKVAHCHSMMSGSSDDSLAESDPAFPLYRWRYWYFGPHKGEPWKLETYLETCVEDTWSAMLTGAYSTATELEKAKGSAGAVSGQDLLNECWKRVKPKRNGYYRQVMSKTAASMMSRPWSEPEGIMRGY